MPHIVQELAVICPWLVVKSAQQLLQLPRRLFDRIAPNKAAALILLHGENTELGRGSTSSSMMAIEASQIGKNMVKSVATGEVSAFRDEVKL